ncbi:MAG: hypothetical protein RBT74_10875 [Tenuifilaceae bacterium]|jgi:hypothetical protein|nr:hypothetical protein [Tenuifilaceae bacterium]
MEKNAASDLLNEAVEFRIGKRKFSMKKLKLGTIVRISKQVLSMQDIDPEQSAIQSVYSNAANLRFATRILAIALLNSRWIGWLYPLLARWLMYQLDTAELAQLMKVVASQVGAQDFFFTMTLTRGMNFLTRKKESSEGENQFTEP